MNGRRRLGWILALALLATPSASAALHITLAGPTSGPVSSGIASESAGGASQISFTIALDAETGITGYDLSVAWDPTEVTLVSAQQLFPDSGAPGPFFVSPLGGDPAGSRVAAIAGFQAVPTLQLFGLTFDLVGASVADGAADVRVYLAPINGPGLSPLGVTLEVPAEWPGIDLVAAPEPATGVLLGAGLCVVAAGRRSRRRRPLG